MITDKRLRKISQEFCAGILENHSSKDMCYVVCNPLATYLSFIGVPCELTEGEIFYDGGKWHHYWITLWTGKIIDPTADQFVKPDGERLKNIWVEILPKEYRRIKNKKRLVTTSPE
jgi:hypothetical protein